MDHTTTQVTLLLPGLELAAAAVAEPDISASLLAEPRLSWHEETSYPWEVSLQRVLGIATDANNIPMARALSSCDEADPVVCADPIHLKADRDTARLVPGSSLGITRHEADQLIASLNEFVKEDGLVFERRLDHGWILKGATGDELATHPPHYLAECAISSYLSEAEGGEQLRRWQTEWQMLLHHHPVNQARVANGELPINSVWIWGGGQLPPVVPDASLVYTKDDTASAFCGGLGVPVKTLPKLKVGSELSLDTNSTIDRIVILDTSLLDAWLAKDIDSLTHNLSLINEALLPSLVSLFDKRRVASVEIVTQDGHRAALQVAGGWLTRIRQAISRS